MEMNQQQTGSGECAAQKKIADEFSSWPCTGEQVERMNEIRGKLDETLDFITNRFPPQNGRYLAIVKTKLEEAGMFAIKGLSKP